MVIIVLLSSAGLQVLVLMLFVLLEVVLKHFVMLMLMVVLMGNVYPGVGVADDSGFTDGCK